ncbi:MAG: DUF3226 domain-containing protein [Thermoguttaceae bacterium]
MANILIVEGPDDVHVISRLLQYCGSTELRNANDKSIEPLKLLFQTRPLDISHVADKGNVLNGFEKALKFESKPCKAIGVVLDFDAPNEEQANNIDISVRDVIARLQVNGCRWNLPDDFDVLSEQGFIAEPADDDTPRIGVWLMPNNKDRGMLETFLHQLIPAEKLVLFSHAKQSTDVAKKEFNAPFKAVHLDKAMIHTFLAWMDEPGKPFGISFQNGSFDAKAPLAQLFCEWIKRLFRD